MPLSAVQEKLKTIPDEYMTEVYNYMELLQYKILYKKMHENSVKKISKPSSRYFKKLRFLHVTRF